ncbi:hypothetical protein BKA59DRAFT_470873 [Fusarium tricinctum]|uniref:Uncharacterized protein n=1 Tax=Fusarium tricinctum TaxID=61284 RepID=A0A8K0S4V2_9HYPO|nr:hypothetical protein BKA59DRAFT_470873 [Fusarium tricinctum]
MAFLRFLPTMYLIAFSTLRINFWIVSWLGFSPASLIALQRVLLIALMMLYSAFSMYFSTFSVLTSTVCSTSSS